MIECGYINTADQAVQHIDVLIVVLDEYDFRAPDLEHAADFYICLVFFRLLKVQTGFFFSYFFPPTRSILAFSMLECQFECLEPEHCIWVQGSEKCLN